MSELKDRFGRKIDYLRISVTDRCNLNCKYCVPQKSVHKIMNEYEIIKAARLFGNAGISRFKITGGEPLLRDDIGRILKGIRSFAKSLTITTNGILLDERDISAVDSVNISLDTLDPKRYAMLTGVDMLDRVLRNIRECNKEIHINCIPIYGVNEDELHKIAMLAVDSRIYVRFIELMPSGKARDMKAIPNKHVMNIIQTHIGKLVPENSAGNGPAVYYHADGLRGKIGFISAVTECFCKQCNRIRLSSDCHLRLCLHHKESYDIYPLLKMQPEKAVEEIRRLIEKKPGDHAGFKDNGVEGLWNIGG